MLKLVITCDLREIGGEINVKPATFGLCKKPDNPNPLDSARWGAIVEPTDLCYMTKFSRYDD